MANGIELNLDAVKDIVITEVIICVLLARIRVRNRLLRRFGVNIFGKTANTVYGLPSKN